MRAKIFILGLVCLCLILSCDKKIKNPYSPEIPDMQLLTINYFTADQSEILYGDSTMLSWSVSNATKVSLSHGSSRVDVPPVGTLEISPVERTTFVLHAYGTEDIMVRADVVVEVRSGFNLKIIGEPQYTFHCGTINYWTFEARLTIKNVGNEHASGTIWFRMYTDPNATLEPGSYPHESYIGAVGQNEYFDSCDFPWNAQRDIEFVRQITENEEENECESVRDGKIIVDLAFH